MKIHPPILQCIIQCLRDIFGRSYYADKVLQYRFRENKKLGSRDRKLIAEAIYDIVRWWRLLWFVLDVPQYEENYKYIFQLWLWWKKETPTDELFVLRSKKEIAAAFERANKTPAVVNSIPDWLQKLGRRELKDLWDENISAMNQEAKVYLRVNLNLTTVNELYDELFLEGIPCKILSEETLVLLERKNVFVTNAFKAGFFEVQDLSSQMIVPKLGLQSGMRVIDACAGAGGKSLHMARLMNNKGKIIALDIHRKKLEELKKRSKRAKVSIIESREIEGTKTIKRLRETADVVLLDVPCSGLGVLKRNPDTKWKLSPEGLEEILQLQQRILSDYSKMLKPGGKLMYATCSILPCENSQQVQKFLANNSRWELISEHTTFPSRQDADGFYSAILSKT